MSNKKPPPIHNYMYHDHTADIRIQVSGSLNDCLVGLCLGVFNYMTDLSRVKSKLRRSVVALGSTLPELVYNWMVESFALYGQEYFIVNAVNIDLFSEEVNKFRLEASCWGSIFDSKLHTQGTEVKAITKHDMQIEQEQEDKWTISVLVDI